MKSITPSERRLWKNPKNNMFDRHSLCDICTHRTSLPPSLSRLPCNVRPNAGTSTVPRGGGNEKKRLKASRAGQFYARVCWPFLFLRKMGRRPRQYLALTEH